MSTLSWDELDRIQEEYHAYLETHGVPCGSGNCSLFLPKDTKKFYIEVGMGYEDGKIGLSAYFGSAYSKTIGPVRKFEKAVREELPGYTVETATFHRYIRECSLICDVEYTSVEALHQQAEQLAANAQIALDLGKEMLDDFEDP